MINSPRYIKENRLDDEISMYTDLVHIRALIDFIEAWGTSVIPV